MILISREYQSSRYFDVEATEPRERRNMQSDKITPIFDFRKPFKVSIPHRDDRAKEPIVKVNVHVWYTDGSKTVTGTGLGIYEAGTNNDVSINLESYTTAQIA